MRISELPFIQEVRDAYILLRRQGKSRAEATQEMLGIYENELTLGADDDGLMVWVGLADAQYTCKEITSEIAAKGIEAINEIENTDWEISKGDLARRRAHYAEAPMPEKKMGPPRKKFQCSWEIGDTFAYRIEEIFYDQEELRGKYALIRKVANMPLWDGRIVPMVTFSIWPDSELPKTSEDFQTVVPLKLNARRMGTPPGLFEYRTAIMFSTKKQIERASLIYIGNFVMEMPSNEQVFTRDADVCMAFPKMLSQEICVRYRAHKRYDKEYKENK